MKERALLEDGFDPLPFRNDAAAGQGTELFIFFCLVYVLLVCPDER